jgi:hypothetical protein
LQSRRPPERHARPRCADRAEGAAPPISLRDPRGSARSSTRIRTLGQHATRSGQARY